MSINAKQLKELVIIPTLDYLELNSQAAQNLLLGTCAQESLMGKYLKQVTGPALGIYQIEPATHRDIIQRYLYQDEYLNLRERISRLITQKNQYGDKDQELIFNLNYATAIARIIYFRAPEKLPDANDIAALAKYYKKYFNTPLGAATEQQFIENYKKYVSAN